MTQQRNRRSNPSGVNGDAALIWVGIVVVALVVGVPYAAVHLGHRLSGTGAVLPGNPFDLFFGLLDSTVPWPPSGTWVAGGLVLGLCLVAALLTMLALRLRRGRTRVDRAATYMGRGRDLHALSRKGATETARRLGVEAPGLPIGRTVTDGRALYGTWEDMHIDIWGPRTGKTTSRAVPAILAAPGAVLVTSNKRDVVDATRDVRAADGQPVWVFDPQGIAGEEPTWWWNPLSYVTDEVTAARLAEHFAAGSRDPGARTDAYFDPAGQDLLAGLLLAAALGQRPITDVYTWLTRPTDERPVEILTDHGFDLIADQVAGVIAAPDKQRGGIYGTAQQMASCLTNRAVARWVTPQTALERRPHFDPATFVGQGGTLYSLSKEGRGTAGPLVTALTVAVVEAAEQQASRSAGGRLAVPLVGVLDEAANVCRWRELPNLYSHYGSRGIVLMTILQSWSQGVEVWGRDGMRKLWSASNVAVYGGGVKEPEFLGELSQLIGDYDLQTASVTSGRGHRSVSRQLRRERILDVADLGAMPRGRAVVLASGAPPTLIHTVPWMAGPHAEAVRASIAAHDPQAAQTLAAVERDAATVADELAAAEAAGAS